MVIYNQYTQLSSQLATHRQSGLICGSTCLQLLSVLEQNPESNFFWMKASVMKVVISL